MTVTDAQFDSLSGDLTSLEDAVLDNERLILGLPDKSDFNAMQMYNSQKFNTIDTEVSGLAIKIDEIIEYIQNLKLSHTELENLFFVYTGSLSTGAIT